MQNRERMSGHVVCIKITLRWCTQTGRQPGDWHNQVSSDALQAQGSCCRQFVLPSGALARASSQMPQLFGLTEGFGPCCLVLWCSSPNLFKAVKKHHYKSCQSCHALRFAFSWVSFRKVISSSWYLVLALRSQETLKALGSEQLL